MGQAVSAVMAVLAAGPEACDGREDEGGYGNDPCKQYGDEDEEGRTGVVVPQDEVAEDEGAAGPAHIEQTISKGKQKLIVSCCMVFYYPQYAT